MGTVRFYHLTQVSLEATLPKLLAKALSAGLRVEIRVPDAERRDWLDSVLWQGDEAEFLPHGIAGGPHDALQPVLLTGAEPARAETCLLISVDGAAIASDEVAGIDRVFVVFDGNDAQALAHARGQWKELKDAGITAEYWSEESGRWERKA